MADLIGVRSAFDAMEASPSTGGAESELQRERAFFVAYAQVFCAMDEDEHSTVSSSFNTHPSTLLRINGVVSQSAAFARAFACQPGRPMAPETRCAPW